MGVSPRPAIGQFVESLHLPHRVYLCVGCERRILVVEQSPALPRSLQAQAIAPNSPLPQP